MLPQLAALPAVQVTAEMKRAASQQPEAARRGDLRGTAVGCMVVRHPVLCRKVGFRGKFRAGREHGAGHGNECIEQLRTATGVR